MRPGAIKEPAALYKRAVVPSSSNRVLFPMGNMPVSLLESAAQQESHTSLRSVDPELFLQALRNHRIPTMSSSAGPGKVALWSPDLCLSINFYLNDLIINYY